MKKGFSAILVLVVVLLLGLVAGGYYYMSLQQPKQDSDIEYTDTTSDEDKDKDTTPVTTDIPEDWETYISDEYGFTFRYPSEANLNDDSNNYMSISFMGQKQKDSGRTQTELFDGYSFNVVDLTDEGDFEDLNEFAQSRIDQLKEVCSEVSDPSMAMVNENKYVSVDTVCLGDFTNYYFENNGNYLEVGMLATGDEEDLPEYEKIVEKIFSTFDFTN